MADTKKLNINPIVKIMIYSDFLILSGFALYGPIFAIFITRQIQNGSAHVVGLAVASYWAVRSVVQLPISRFLDKYDGERDDFWAMIGGSFLISIVPFLFIFAKFPWHIYLLMMIYGLGDSLSSPTYLSIFSHHIDKEKENFEWGLRSVLIGIGIGIAGAVGGYLADKFGFEIVFILTGILAIIGSAVLIFIRRSLLLRPKPMTFVPATKDHI